MADEEQVRLLNEKGVKAWNEWRRANPEARVDFSGMSFRGFYLNGVNLRGANLVGVNLKEATLIDGNLCDANLSEAFLPEVTLYGADLAGANLTEANMQGADLIAVNLDGATLSYAILAEADLTRAKLTKADLKGVYLMSSYLRGADLSGAILREADLRGADLSEADLRSTDFNYCHIGATLFGNVDLSRSIGLDTVIHRGPSTIGIDSVYRSRGNIPEVFLRQAGIPESFIAQIGSLVGALSAVEFYSCFISYSHADKAFAQRLHDTLQSKGVRCWLDEHQLLPGDDIYHEVDRGIRLWDKMLLCCSENSLKSWWVDNEIGTAFEKEQQLMKDREAKVQALVPLNLDGYLFSDKWQSGYQSQVRRRLAADFTEASDAGKFDEQVERLIKALRADEGAREKPPKQRL